MAMISRSEGFANAFLAFLNPNHDIKDMTEAPPISRPKLSIPFQAEPPKPKRGRGKQKVSQDVLDEDEIPILNIIPNRQEGQECEVEADPSSPQEDTPSKALKKRGAAQVSPKTPPPKKRAKKIKEVEEEILASEGEDDLESDEEEEEELVKEFAGDSDFEVELKEAPNRRNVSSRRSARVTRKSFADLLKEDDTDETDSDDIIEVPSSSIKSKVKPKSSSLKSQKRAKKQIPDAENPKEIPKAKTPLTKSKKTGRRQSPAPKAGSSNQSRDSSEENSEKIEKSPTQAVGGPIQNKPVIGKTRGRKKKVDPERENPQPEPVSKVETEARPNSVRAREPSRKASIDLDDEPLVKSARMSKSSARKRTFVAKTTKIDVQEVSASKQSDPNNTKSMPTLKIKPQAGLEILKTEQKTESTNKRKNNLETGESGPKSPENSTDFDSQSRKLVTSPSKPHLVDRLAENAAKDAILKYSSNVVAINCSRCAKQVATEQELMSHFNEVHRAEILKANQSKVKIKSMTKLYACPHCPYKTEWESSLGIHLKLSHGNTPKAPKTMAGDR